MQTWCRTSFPLSKILNNQQMDSAVNNAKGKKNNQDMRTVQFCLGMSKWWNDPVHVILQECETNMDSRGYE
jgi:hypothetical protein